MGTSDRGSGEDYLGWTWASFGRRLAVAAGAATALVALLAGVPVRVASLRGALAWLGVLLVTRIAAAVQARDRHEPLAAEEAATATEDTP